MCIKKGEKFPNSRKVCNQTFDTHLGIACKFQEENNEVDYIDLLEEILELDYKNLLTSQSSQVVMFKVQWS